MSAPIEKLQPGLNRGLQRRDEGWLAKGIQASPHASENIESGTVRRSERLNNRGRLHFQSKDLTKFSSSEIFIFPVILKRNVKTRRLKYSRHEDRYLRISRALNELS